MNTRLAITITLIVGALLAMGYGVRLLATQRKATGE